MAETLENLVLAQLREIRGIVQKTRIDVRDLKRRMTSLENQVAQMHVGLGHVHADFAGQSARHDQIDTRSDRINRRLDLADADPER